MPQALPPLPQLHHQDPVCGVPGDYRVPRSHTRFQAPVQTSQGHGCASGAWHLPRAHCWWRIRVWAALAGSGGTSCWRQGKRGWTSGRLGLRHTRRRRVAALPLHSSCSRCHCQWAARPCRARWHPCQPWVRMPGALRAIPDPRATGTTSGCPICNWRAHGCGCCQCGGRPGSTAPSHVAGVGLFDASGP